MTEAVFLQRLGNTGRNDPCPCGSGKKYKRCHLREDEEAEREFLAEQEKARVDSAVEASDGEAQPDSEPKTKSRQAEAKPSPRPETGKGSKQSIHPRRSGRSGR